MSDQDVEHEIELEGQMIRLTVRPAVADQPKFYTFDGERWNADMHLAYKSSREAGTLRAVGIAEAAPPGDDERQALLLTLHEAISKLLPGESLRVYRDASMVMVTKENVLIAVDAKSLGVPSGG